MHAPRISTASIAWAVPIFVGLLAGATVHAQSSGAWLKDEKSGCSVQIPESIFSSNSGQFGFGTQPASLLPAGVRSPKIGWSGPCESGKAMGTGTLTFYEEGINLFSLSFLGANGHRMADGKIVADEAAIGKAVRFSVTSCRPLQWPMGRGSREIRGDVDAQIDLTSHAVLSKLFAMAERFAWEKCPLVKYESRERFTMSPQSTITVPYLADVAVQLFVGGTAQVRATSYETRGGTDWGRYSNRLRESLTRGAELRLQAGRQQRAEDERQRRELQARVEREVREAEERRIAEAQRRALNEKTQESRRVFDEFQRQAGISQWPSGSDLRANPFVFRGKIIGIRANFDAMLAEGEAFFTLAGGPVHISGVPTTRFQRAGTTALLAVKVTGTKQIEFLGTKMPVPHLEYVDAYLCKNSDCEDVLFWASRSRAQ